MLVIKTTQEGRQKLLSNLKFRNYLYGKFFTIEIAYEDEYEDGVLKEPKATCEIEQYIVYDAEVYSYLEQNSFIEKTTA
jgi:hypothetical protein